MMAHDVLSTVVKTQAEVIQVLSKCFDEILTQLRADTREIWRDIDAELAQKAEAHNNKM